MAEKSKLIKQDFNSDFYRKLATKKVEENDLLGALGFLFCALEKVDFSSPNDVDILADIADVYGDMGILEHANNYWFKYLEKAPKEKRSLAYNELAVNFFYLDDFWASGYYFHKKISADGFISKESLDPEIVEFLSDEVNPKDKYFLAYPFNRADYSPWIKKAKKFMAVCDFEKAEKLLSSVPQECLNEEGAGDYAMSVFLQDKHDKVIEISRKSLEINGENVTAFCNLSMAYRAKGDSEKATFYYKKALNCAKIDKKENHALTTCALEEGDIEVALKCMDKILQDHPFDPDMLFFYGLAWLNGGDYKKGTDALKKAHKIAPNDYVIKFYYNCALSLKAGDCKYQSELPFKYVKDLPKGVTTNYRRRINDWAKDLKRRANVVQKQESLDVLTWGIRCVDEAIARKSVFILAQSSTPKTIAILSDFLLEPHASPKIKKIAVFALIAGGYRGRICALIGNVLVRGKPAKLVFDKHVLGNVYVGAYALCVSKMMFLGFEETNKLAFSINKIFTKLGETPCSIMYTSDEFAALTLYLSKQKEFSEIEQVCAIFDVEKDRLEELINQYKGEKNDKNN